MDRYAKYLGCLLAGAAGDALGTAREVFGMFNGWVKLDDGTRFEVYDLRGFAEAVHNVY